MIASVSGSPQDSQLIVPAQWCEELFFTLALSLSHTILAFSLLIIFSVLTIAWATQRLVKLMYYFNVISGMCVICIYDVLSADRVYAQVMAYVRHISIASRVAKFTRGLSSYISNCPLCLSPQESNSKLYSELRSQHIDSAKKQLKIPTVTTFGALSSPPRRIPWQGNAIENMLQECGQDKLQRRRRRRRQRQRQ